MSLYRASRNSQALTLDEVRSVDPAEEQALQEAIRYCREYAERVPVRLVLVSRANLQEAVDRLQHEDSRHQTFRVAQQVDVALVSFLLMWRLFLDHVSHDLSQRFGKPSPEFDRFDQATHNAFDGHPGYRLVEGLRNYVQHVGLPPVTYTVSRRRGTAGEPETVAEATVSLDRQKLVDWKKCSALLRKDLAAGQGPLPLLSLIDDAMEGFASLVAVVTQIDGPELAQHIELLQALVDEAAPDVPVLAEVSPGSVPGGANIKMIRFGDLEGLLNVATSRTTVEDLANEQM